MTAVVNYVRGPADQLDSPVSLIDALHEPLRLLCPSLDWSDEPLSDVAVISEAGSIAPDVHEWAGVYGNALFTDSADIGSRWLPPWAWQRTEQVERDFNASIRTGSDEEYVATREFVITHPAGIESELLAARSRMKALPAGDFAPIPVDRVLAGWWWPCPVCSWPMRVSDDRVRCDIRRHEADFDVAVPARDGKGPSLRRRTGRGRPAKAVRAERARCVSAANWRFIVVPGLAEIHLRDDLESIAGVHVDLWPDKDQCDLSISVGDALLEVDVKDHARATSIINKPPSVEWLVVPDGRRDQLRVLSERLPNKKVVSSRQLVRHVTRLAGLEEVG